MANETIISQSEIEDKIKNPNEDEIDFVINTNNIIGQLGSTHFQITIDAVSKALFSLQKDNIARNILNITLLANKILQLQCQLNLNRAEVICILYYLQHNIGNVYMDMDVTANDMPVWSIKDEIFEKLCMYQ